MRTLLLLLVSLPQEDDRRTYSASGLAVVFLGRHQIQDGSWGARPGTCGCPFEPEVLDPEILRKASALLDKLGSDSSQERSEAQKGIWALGPEIRPLVGERADRGDLETRLRCHDLLRQKGRFCSGKGDMESTSLAVLAFLWEGHTHHSKEVLNGIPVGQVLGNGLRWIITTRLARPDDRSSDPAGHVLSSLALVEAFGRSNDGAIEAMAKQSLQGLAASEDEPTELLAWKGLLHRSAVEYGLRTDASKDLARIAALLKDRPERLAPFAAYLCTLWSGETPDPDALGVRRCVDPLQLDPTALFFGTLVIQHALGRQDLVEHWFGDGLKESLLLSQKVHRRSCEEGSWILKSPRETFRKTALLAATMQIYYRYVASPGTWKVHERGR